MGLESLRQRSIYASVEKDVDPQGLLEYSVMPTALLIICLSRFRAL